MPFQILYNQPPYKFLRFLLGESTIDGIAIVLDDCNEVMHQLHYNLERAQHHMKEQTYSCCLFFSWYPLTFTICFILQISFVQ